MQIYPLGFELGFYACWALLSKKEWKKYKTAFFSPLCTSYGTQACIWNRCIKQVHKGSGYPFKICSRTSFFRCHCMNTQASPRLFWMLLVMKRILGALGWLSQLSTWLCSGHDLAVCGFEPHNGLCADSWEPEASLDSVFPSLSDHHPLMLCVCVSLSLSQK